MTNGSDHIVWNLSIGIVRVEFLISVGEIFSWIILSKQRLISFEFSFWEFVWSEDFLFFFWFFLFFLSVVNNSMMSIFHSQEILFKILWLITVISVNVNPVLISDILISPTIVSVWVISPLNWNSTIKIIVLRTFTFISNINFGFLTLTSIVICDIIFSTNWFKTIARSLQSSKD